MSETCLVYRKRGKPWEFKTVEGFAGLRHTTAKGTEYGLFIDDDPFKPVWIGRFVPGTKRGPVWVTYENRLGATRVVFGNGGEYRFPGESYE